MTVPHIYGIRGVAGLSLLLAITLMLTSSFVFLSHLDDLKSSKFIAAKVPANISNENPTENKRYVNTLENLNKLWTKNRPVLVSSAMLAILAGLLQAIFSGLVVLADAKTLTIYIRKWVTVHFILFFILFIIIMNTVVLIESSMHKQSWEQLVQYLKKTLDKERPKTDYSELYRFLSHGKLLLYIPVGIDMPMIVIMMVIMFYMMRNYKGEYEPV